MKVYVVLECNRETDYEYCGVYLTEEQAKNRIKEIVDEFGTDKDSLYIQDEELE